MKGSEIFTGEHFNRFLTLYGKHRFPIEFFCHPFRSTFEHTMILGFFSQEKKIVSKILRISILYKLILLIEFSSLVAEFFIPELFCKSSIGSRVDLDLMRA